MAPVLRNGKMSTGRGKYGQGENEWRSWVRTVAPFPKGSISHLFYPFSYVFFLSYFTSSSPFFLSFFSFYSLSLFLLRSFSSSPPTPFFLFYSSSSSSYFFFLFLLSLLLLLLLLLALLTPASHSLRSSISFKQAVIINLRSV